MTKLNKMIVQLKRKSVQKHLKHYAGGSVRLRKRRELNRDNIEGSESDYDETAADVEETDDQEEGKSSIEPKLESILRLSILRLRLVK